MNRGSFSAIASVAYKEFLHIYRDRRVLMLLLILPPVFTVIFGHAFESGERKGVPVLLINKDDNPRTQRFIDLALTRKPSPGSSNRPRSVARRICSVRACAGRSLSPRAGAPSLTNGDPLPLQFYLDGGDTNASEQLQGRLQKTLGDFQMSERDVMIDDLPEQVFDMAKQLPVEVRKQFVSAMTPWKIEGDVLYNPDERFIGYVLPGVIGIILQLITVTLMACTIARGAGVGDALPVNGHLASSR